MMESSFLQIAWGALKTEKVYMGMECKTELMRVNLPAWDRSLAFQP